MAIYIDGLRLYWHFSQLCERSLKKNDKGGGGKEGRNKGNMIV